MPSLTMRTVTKQIKYRDWARPVNAGQRNIRINNRKPRRLQTRVILRVRNGFRNNRAGVRPQPSALWVFGAPN
ncbi:hypothetical protein FUAX_46380 (plasmid) [Fulvitalea axinellae]|uniref:Uncharacterized protein n=1 Tax=Fulvitalea axinellae TaxID=1182444 RepID=A0AAU9DGF5_9BACT|nr:hypothetical protein FUAX_46380 [Fulvitalea axinellae]